MAVVFKCCVPLPMPCAISVALPDRLGRRRPNDTQVIIANINGGAWLIGYWVIEPRREAIALAISAPDEFGARLRNQRTKLRIGHDVDPWKRRLLVGCQIDDEFLSVPGKATQPIEIFQLHERQRRRGLFAELPARR